MNNSCLFLFFVNVWVVLRNISAQSSQGSAAVNQFTQNLLPLICEDGENCAISGFSIFNALGLVYAGAQSETQSQIQNVLNLNGLNMQDVHQIFKNTKDSVFSVDSEIELFLANRFYGENTIYFLSEYSETLQNFYNSDAINLNFLNDPEGSRQEINLWVEEITKNLIQNLLLPGSITSNTISVLANALYFKGAWIEQFDAENTKPRQFTTYAGNVINVPTMANFEKDYIIGEIQNMQFSFIKLLYQGGYTSMYIIVPKTLNGTSSNNSINTILQNINFTDIIYEGQFNSVNLYLPKFTVEFETILSDPLKKLGMVDAFDAQNANFGGMVDLEKNQQNIFLSEGFHKAKVIVDENGTEAAAATAMVASFTSAWVFDEVIDFVVDQPFGFCIVKEPENVILFNGIINNPISE